MQHRHTVETIRAWGKGGGPSPEDVHELRCGVCGTWTLSTLWADRQAGLECPHCHVVHEGEHLVTVRKAA